MNQGFSRFAELRNNSEDGVERASLSYCNIEETIERERSSPPTDRPEKDLITRESLTLLEKGI